MARSPFEQEDYVDYLRSMRPLSSEEKKAYEELKELAKKYDVKVITHDSVEMEIPMAYKFDKSKFPGLGTYAPDKLSSAGPVFPDKPTISIDTETVEAKKESIAQQINKALAPFLGKVMGVDFGKEDAKAVVAKVLENEILEIQTVGGIPSAVSIVPVPHKATISVGGKVIGVVDKFKVLPASQEEKNVGLSKLAAKDKAKKKSKPNKKGKKAEPIYKWTFTSSQEIQGEQAQYTTQLRADKSTSCNCPGWVFWRDKSAPRSCKHTRAVENDGRVDDIWKKFKKGEALPNIEKQSAGSEIPGMTVSGASLNYSRKMDI